MRAIDLGNLTAPPHGTLSRASIRKLDDTTVEIGILRDEWGAAAIARYELTEVERFMIAKGADLFVSIYTPPPETAGDPEVKVPVILTSIGRPGLLDKVESMPDEYTEGNILSALRSQRILTEEK